MAGRAAVPKVWCEHPYHGDFNPGTKSGKAISAKKTKGLSSDDRFSVTKKDPPDIRRFLIGKQADLGKVVSKIPIAFDAAGDPTEYANLFTQYGSISFERLQRIAHARFCTEVAAGDPLPPGPWSTRQLDPANVPADKKTFYDRVNSQVVAQLVQNILTPEGYSKLLQGKKNKIGFFCDQTGNDKIDGPCLIKLLFDRIDPSVVVGIESLRQRIETCKLHTHSNNVDEMLSMIEECYEKITDQGATCESINRYTLNSLLSGPSADFNSYIKRIKDDIDSQTGPHANISFEDLCLAARNKYLNMEAAQEYTVVDPKDSRIMALTTKLEALEEKVAKSVNATSGYSNPRSGGGRGESGNVEKVKGMPEWRTIKTATSVEKDGLIWHWCKHHKGPEGAWDGLYVRHEEKDHDAHMARFKNKRSKFDKEDKGSKGSEDKLVIGQRLKEVLCSKLMLDDNDAEQYCQEIIQGKD